MYYWNPAVISILSLRCWWLRMFHFASLYLFFFSSGELASSPVWFCAVIDSMSPSCVDQLFMWMGEIPVLCEHLISWSLPLQTEHSEPLLKYVIIKPRQEGHVFFRLFPRKKKKATHVYFQVLSLWHISRCPVSNHSPLLLCLALSSLQARKLSGLLGNRQNETNPKTLRR